MKLIINDIELNDIKKIAILLGRDFKTIQEREKAKGKDIKTDAELLAEIKTDVDNKVKTPKKK